MEQVLRRYSVLDCRTAEPHAYDLIVVRGPDEDQIVKQEDDKITIICSSESPRDDAILIQTSDYVHHLERHACVVIPVNI